MINDSEVNIAVSLDDLRDILGLPDCDLRRPHNTDIASHLQIVRVTIKTAKKAATQNLQDAFNFIPVSLAVEVNCEILEGEDDSDARRGQGRERASVQDFVIDVTVCISRRGVVDLYVTGGNVQDEEQTDTTDQGTTGVDSRGQIQGHYTSVKRPEKKSDADGTAILKGEEVGGESKENRTF
ncbi:hypothetical protein GQ600_12909 [Phytophthora cactorum]|nr:hypothetical protein GQ600_12909 [Phytophthora cactorum]